MTLVRENSLLNDEVTDRGLSFAVIAVGFVVLGCLYALSIPPWLAYDEPWHFIYVYDILHSWRIPSMYRNYEAVQTPLYYFTSAILIKIAGIKSAYPGAYFLRFYNVGLGLIFLWTIYRFLARLFSENSFIPLMGMAFVATIPAFLADSATVTNDMMACVFTGACALAALDMMKKGATGSRMALLGLLIGLAVLSKPIEIGLLPLIFIAAFWDRSPGGKTKRRLILLLIGFGVVGILSGWWFIRNIMLFGDPFGFSATQAYGGHQATALFPVPAHKFYHLRYTGLWAAQNFNHFWSFSDYLRTPEPHVPMAFNWLFLAISVIPAAGFVFRPFSRKKPMTPDQKRGLALSIALFMLLGFIYIWNNLTYWAPSARYMYPAIVFPAFVAALGWRGIIPRRARNAVLWLYWAIMILVNLVLVVGFLWPIINPPSYFGMQLMKF